MLYKQSVCFMLYSLVYEQTRPKKHDSVKKDYSIISLE